MSGAHLTRQCNWHQISTTGEDYTDRTDYVSKGSVIVNPTKQQDLHPGPFVQFFWHCVCHNNVSHPNAMYWIGCLNLLVFCSPIVPPSFWGGQVAKGCKSGVASKYAKTRTTLVHPDWRMKFRQNKNWSYSRLCNKWFHHHTPQVCLKLRTSRRKN